MPEYEDQEATPDATAIAERAVVGECITYPNSVRAVSAVVTPADFRDIRLGQLYGLVLGMVTAGGPASVTPPGVFQEVAARRTAETIEDRDAGRSGRNRIAWHTAGELAFLVTHGTHGRVEEIAKVIRENAVLRALATFGRRLTAQAEGGADAATTAAAAVEESKRIRDGARRVTLQARPLAEVLDEDDVYEWLIPGLLERGDRLIVTGAEGGGKALALDTPIPTPAGWTTMGDLAIGQEVFSADGTPTTVTMATDVMLDRPCYRVTFSDGSAIVADEEHRWLTETLIGREATAKGLRNGTTPTIRPGVVTTGEIRDTLRARGGHALNHSIATCEPLQYPEQELLIDPYVLGAWLGDGHSASARITMHPDDVEVIDRIRAAGYTVTYSKDYLWSITRAGQRAERLAAADDLAAAGMSRRRAERTVGLGGAARGGQVPMLRPFVEELRAIGVLGNKHIPEAYLRGSVAQRLALLQGLMDTDGYVLARKNSHKCEFVSTAQELAEAVLELALSLGIKATMAKGTAKLNGVEIGPKWRITFTSTLPVFHLTRKAIRQIPSTTRRSSLRYITSVEPIESVPVRCIQVAHESRLYLAGRECIPTHNTTLRRQIALCAAGGIHPFTSARFDPLRVLEIDCENSERQWRRSTRGVALAVKQASGIDAAAAVNLACIGRLDITSAGDLGALHALMDEYEPDLLMIGPLYKLVPWAINTDSEAAPVLAALDSLRERGPALIMEAHAGHAQGKGGEREYRPRGSASLMGWPEFGFGLAPDLSEDGKSVGRVDVIRWRGDRDEREWPKAMRRGGRLPWTDDRQAWSPASALGRAS